MIENHFYHHTIRNSVAVFGRLFNDIHVVRHDAGGKNISQLKVPLAYAPKQKFLDRLEVNDLEDDTRMAIKLPRMSFEITSMLFDPERQTPKTNALNLCKADGTRSKLFVGVPYILNFQLNIMAKTQDDALQIFEQIVPYFKPDYSIDVKPFKDFPEYKETLPISLVSTSFQDDFEGPQEQRRVIIYTLDFEMKIMFNGPIRDSSIIRKAIVDYENMNGTLLQRLIVEPDPIDANLITDDFGFTETVIIPGHGDSA